MLGLFEAGCRASQRFKGTANQHVLFVRLHLQFGFSSGHPLLDQYLTAF